MRILRIKLTFRSQKLISESKYPTVQSHNRGLISPVCFIIY